MMEGACTAFFLEMCCPVISSHVSFLGFLPAGAKRKPATKPSTKAAKADTAEPAKKKAKKSK